jgi:hypothetical protein
MALEFVSKLLATVLQVVLMPVVLVLFVLVKKERRS